MAESEGQSDQPPVVQLSKEWAPIIMAGLQAKLNDERRATITRLQTALAQAEPTQLPDGPEPPDGFNHQGQTYRGLATKPFLAVSFLWGRRNKSARSDELAGPVWQDHEHELDPDRVAIQGLRREINRFFRKNRIPWHAMVKADHLCLREGPPR